MTEVHPDCCEKEVFIVEVVSLEGLDSTGCWASVVTLAEDEKDNACSGTDGGSLNTTGSFAQAFTNFANGLPRIASSVALRHALMLRRSRIRESCDLSEGSTRAAAGGASTFNSTVGVAAGAAEEDVSNVVEGRGRDVEKVVEEDIEAGLRIASLLCSGASEMGSWVSRGIGLSFCEDREPLKNSG